MVAARAHVGPEQRDAIRNRPYSSRHHTPEQPGDFGFFDRRGDSRSPERWSEPERNLEFLARSAGSAGSGEQRPDVWDGRNRAGSDDGRNERHSSGTREPAGGTGEETLRGASPLDA